MIRLTANVISAAITLFLHIEKRHIASFVNMTYFKIDEIAMNEVFEFSANCGWVKTEEDIPILTDRGNLILQLYKEAKPYRPHMIQDYIVQCAPIWSSRIPYGRQEASLFMSDDERACFIEAGLLNDDVDINVIRWWDELAECIRNDRVNENIKTGRRGEQLTMLYEQKRTCVNPKWMSIESNLVGYDVQSVVDKDVKIPLLIEVKASSGSIYEAWFHITAQEWRVATTSKFYVFHIWLLSPNNNKLATITPDEITPHMPTNNSDGLWENTKIPYASFENKFISID